MKKVLSLVAVASMLSMVACGPSAESLEKSKRAKEDSTRAADSVANVNVQTEARAKATADSLQRVAEFEKAKADSLQKASETSNKKSEKATKKAKEVKKAVETNKKERG